MKRPSQSSLRSQGPTQLPSQIQAHSTFMVGPLYPILRANPFPEVTDLFCRLPLSTLFYRLEAVHLGDLMRLWVRPGKIKAAPPDFQGPSEARRTPQSCGALPAAEPYLRMIRFQGLRAVKKKRELFPGPPPTSPGSLTLPSLPCPGEGILTLFPFDGRPTCGPWYRITPSLRID